MPAVSGINHITFAVSDVERSIGFYRDVLGCELRAFWSDGAYLEAGSLWICLSRDDQLRTAPNPDYTHVAFSVIPGDFAPMCERIRAICPIWKDNRSEGDSLYFLDPDRHKLELHVGTLESRLAHYATVGASNVTIVR